MVVMVTEYRITALLGMYGIIWCNFSNLIALSESQTYHDSTIVLGNVNLLDTELEIIQYYLGIGMWIDDNPNDS